MNNPPKLWISLDSLGHMVKGGHHRSRVYFHSKENSIKWASKDERVTTIVEFKRAGVVWEK